jgi:hypothetical protein
MERLNPVFTSNANQSPPVTGLRRPTLLTWWYHIVAPPEPLASATLAQREKARHGKLASLTIPVFMLFLFALFLQSMNTQASFLQRIVPLAGLEICTFTLLLNRRGFIGLAGVMIITLQYVGAIITLLNYPVGLTIESLPVLDLAIVPSMLVLAFFPAKGLFPIALLNIVMDWCIVMYGPHDAVIAGILRDHPWQIFFYAYLLQFVTTTVLYLWGRSTELAIVRADRAEEIAAFERREKERKERELEQKRPLDAGIQQILQTHVAVANGDLSARAPLHHNYKLWQVANALNNLISRFQKASTEHEPTQPLASQEKLITGSHPAYPLEPQFKETTGSVPIPKRPTIQKPLTGEEKHITGSHPAYSLGLQFKQATGSVPIPKRPAYPFTTTGEEKRITGIYPAYARERKSEQKTSNTFKPSVKEENYITGSHPAYSLAHQSKRETGNVPIPKRPTYRSPV